ncbi:MAG: T9SS type A sorting domain-containing protein [Bacteroidetes bacterium]|nr:T9SS type A sorting domain-containing protein [Bacteroidota bacterium]
MIQKLLCALLFFSVAASAQTTLIPDARFERALIELGIDTDQTINGQMATQDALAVTSLEISEGSLPNYPYSANDIYDGMIHDLTGLEAFVNLQQLIVHSTMAEQINLSSLMGLKRFECADNMLSYIDVSHNSLLEYIDIGTGGDLIPFNTIGELDFSQNPNIQTIHAMGIGKINLNNNNNLQNIQLNIGCFFCWGYPADYIVGAVCIQVDNPAAATQNQLPYSTWNIYHPNVNVHFTNDAALCVLGNETFKAQNISLSPNPARDFLQLETADDITEIKLYDLAGRITFDQKNPEKVINLQSLSSGVYLLEATTEKGVLSQKLIKE